MAKSTGCNLRALVFLLLVGLSTPMLKAQTTAFTYQGRLIDTGNPANGNFDLQFRLFDTVTVGTGAPQGATLVRNPVAVSGGVFNVILDFGAPVFDGADRYLEIGVRPSGSVSAYTVLAPRQPITSTPYAIQTLNAQQLGGLPASGFIQNTTTTQAANFNIDGSGTAGSLNVNGAVSLGGAAAPGPSPAGQGRIYFDSGTNKVRVSENGGAFVNLVGAGGVSGSGTTGTIPFWSDGTTLGNSLITQSGGAVQLPNNVQLAVGAQGNQVQFGSPNSETGMSISGTGGRADLRFDGILKLLNGPGGIPPATNGLAITTAGNVGIGTTIPGSKLTVQTPGDAAYGIGHRSDSVSLSTYIGAGTAGPGGWFGTRSNHPLYFFTNDGGSDLTLYQGRAGFGLASPAHRLGIGDGPSWTSNFWKGALELTNASAIGWQSNAAGNRFGIGQANGGLYFFRTASPLGATTSPAIYDMQITDTGNITQARDKGGLVKAMIYVDPFLPADQYIVRCYNGLTNSSTGNCGFSVVRLGQGFYEINFGFQVDDRFFSLTSGNEFNSGGATGSGSRITVSFVSVLNDDSEYLDTKFHLIVY